MDVNPMKPVLTLYLLNVTRWTHMLDYWRTVLGIQVMSNIGPEVRKFTPSMDMVITVSAMLYSI